MTSRSIFFTIYNRPEYLAPVLDSWSRVRGLDEWDVQFRFEPSNRLRECSDLVEKFISETGLSRVERVVNTERLGVLYCPWVGFEDCFERHNFVVRAEDDLVVSDDILEFFSWADHTYRHDLDVATICAHGGASDDLAAVHRGPGFSPWVWGTWRDRWESLIGPTWDRNYSTYNGTPGHQAGWDWNLNTRIFPRHNKVVVGPNTSRVDNIGVIGVHAQAADYRHVPGYRAHVARQNYYQP